MPVPTRDGGSRIESFQACADAAGIVKSLKIQEPGIHTGESNRPFTCLDRGRGSRSYTIRAARCMGRKGPIHRVKRVVPICL
jgi:hypothetical protein